MLTGNERKVGEVEMKIRIEKTSDPNFTIYAEYASLEQCINLLINEAKENQYVVTKKFDSQCDRTVEIYDFYRE